jgi:exopolyphosphatase / guanosine-5'-triphosphate,3'-diphosphate pyrophosphatase
LGEGMGRGSRRGGRLRGPAPLLAALDLGTNNCRLLIATPGPGGSLRIVDSFSRIVRLGEGVAQSGLLSEAAIARTVDALKICAQHLRARDVRKLRAVATEAARRAANSAVLLQRARDEAGLELEIISADEEARLAAIGCAPLIDAKAQGALIFDIGGGSTEIIWMRRSGSELPRVVALASEPVGVVTLSEEWKDTLDRAGYERMRDAMVMRFAGVKARLDAAGVFDPATHHLLGTSGTVTTLAAVALGLPRYDRTRVDGSWHRCSDILAVIDRLVDLDLKGRAAMGAVGTDRADLIVPGCAVFAAIAQLWPCAQLRVADRGLREGMLRELMARR